MEAKTCYNVYSLKKDLHGKSHIVFIDNFFTSVKLPADFDTLGMYACGTVRFNQVGIPKCLVDKKKFSKFPQKTL